MKGLFKKRNLLNGKPVTEQNIRLRITKGGDGMPPFSGFIGEGDRSGDCISQKAVNVFIGGPMISSASEQTWNENEKDEHSATNAIGRSHAGQDAASKVRVMTNGEINPESRLRLFEEVILPHLDAAHNLARWLTRNEQDACDVVQEAYMRAFRFFDGYKGGDGRSWTAIVAP